MGNPSNTSSHHLPDAVLWEQVCAGEEQAFTQLMQRYAVRLIHYGRKWSADEELVKDCVQDVFTELWLARLRLRAVDSVRAYLLASVRHRIGRLTQRSLRFSNPLSETSENSFTITFSAEDDWIADEESRQQVAQLNRYVNRLSARQREVIYLKFHQNLTQAQIAGVMGINYQSVSNLLQRTLAALRDDFATDLLLWLGVFLAY